MGLREPAALRVVHEDARLVVIDKPSGLLSVPGKGEAGRHNVETLLAQKRPWVRMAHRLDQATSGLLLAAKDIDALRMLQRAFREAQVHKVYEAVLERPPPLSSGEVVLWTRLDVDNRPKQVVDPVHGKRGLTRWQCVRDRRLRLWPLTGRTHQLRVHMAHAQGLGIPILGDRLYGSEGSGADRLHLHACELRFSHPDGGEAAFVSQPWF